MVKPRVIATLLLALVVWRPGCSVAQSPSHIAHDETVVLFPAAGWWDGDGWRIRLHGWVYEREEDSRWRAEFVEALGRGIGLTRAERRSALFTRRAALFVADNERGKRLGLRLGSDAAVQVTPPTGANGRFEAVLECGDVLREPGGPRFDRCAVARANDARGDTGVSGRVFLLAPRGLSVICDIDDTVRISEIGDARSTVVRALVEAYEPVPGMAAFCRGLEERGAAFHYISASPWQLWEDISAFLDREGFPAGSARLRDVRLKDDLGASLLEDSRPFKAAAIDEVLADFPARTFVCIGDSSEHDAPLYAAAMRARPDQVAFVLIRVPPGDDAGRARAERALADLPRERWAVVAEAGEREMAAVLAAVVGVRAGIDGDDEDGGARDLGAPGELAAPRGP